MDLPLEKNRQHAMNRFKIFFFIGIFTLLVNPSAFPQPKDDIPNSCIEIRWDPNHLPSSRNPPFLASHGSYYALKADKYLEGDVDLGQGPANAFKYTGPMTLTAIFQVAKQWPMQAALISKWGFMSGQASYELGTSPDLQIYFKISPGGDYKEGTVELLSTEKIYLEKPTVITSVFNPGKRMSIFIDGRKSSEKTEFIPNQCFDSDTPVKLMCRFEGLLAGVWFHPTALSDMQVRQFADAHKDLLPAGVTYEMWKNGPRKVPKAAADYLNTTPGMKLYKEIDISAYKGSYLCLGDLNNDSRMDFLLYKNGSSYNIPGRLIALDSDGQKLWEKGDAAIQKHAGSGSADIGQPGTSPALRGIATVFDIDHDGRVEVITEFLENDKPMLCILDGQTGQIKYSVPSPIDMSIRQPKAQTVINRQPSRCHPIIRIAWLDGQEKLPSIVLKYGASSGIPCHAFALNEKLNVLWHIEGTRNSMGHIPTVADVDGDGFDEIVLGHMLADHNGTVLWDKGEIFGWHADTTAVDELIPNAGRQILISVCGIGPIYCLNKDGQILWQKSREEIAHGQAVWIGNFIEDLPGKEVIACASGHVGKFVTLKGSDGTTIADFEHKKLMPSYPDFPTVVNWKGKGVQSLWIPQDRAIVNGRGEVVAELGSQDEYVNNKLHCGTSWRPVAAQAFAIDILGDDRDELVLYEPYEGESIFIFTQPDCDPKEKKYVPDSDVYNIRSYF
jgi:hypothetical protein